jgi:hypothetical protein
MSAAIKGLKPGLRLSGHARNIRTMVGDNAAVHAALDLGDVPPFVENCLAGITG